MTDFTRRTFIRAGVLGGTVALLPWGGRAVAGTASAAAGAVQPGQPVPTGGKMLAPMAFMFPDLPPFVPDPDPDTATTELMALANTLLDPNVTAGPGNRDQVGSFGSSLTYLGQFIDHDNFLDGEPQPTAFFGRDNQGNLLDPDGSIVFNLESFRFDLSSVYGGGPAVSPQLYASDGVRMLVQEDNGNGVRDLPRDSSGVAILVEHRNDENEIIAQVHVAFLKFHNAVADAMPGAGFDQVAATVRRHYQWIVIHQFLPHICGDGVVSGLLDGSIPSLYKAGNPNAPLVPVEMQVAAYRFGHSMVRKAYELTVSTGKLQVFNGTAADLHGGRPIPSGRQIDWGNFVLPLQRPENAAHFNNPRFIDTLVSSGLFTLPIGGPGGAEASGSTVLPFRNLLRGFRYGLPSGQDVAAAMGETVISPADALPDNVDSAAITAGFSGGTPLWFYVLREAELGGGLTLGRTGARLVADSFLGSMTADKDGLLHDNSPTSRRWQPVPPIAPAPGQFGLEDLLVCAGVAARP